MLENKDNSDNLIDSAKKGVRKIFLTGAIAAGISSSSTGVEASPIGTEGLDKSLEKNITSPEQKGIDMETTANPYSVESAELEEDILEKEYTLFNTPIKAVMTIRWSDQGGVMPFYFNMHENEKTSVKAAKQLMEQSGGRLLELQHGGGRLVNFEFQGKQYKFDPNRIFTSAGVDQTLKKYNAGNIPIDVQIEVYKFAEKLSQDFNVGAERLVIALHNNSEGSYSIKSYTSGGSESAATQDIHHNDSHDSDNFFYVTDKEDFDELKKLNYNVVLQSKNVPDDGSLSVYASMHNIRYINPEAQDGHEHEQQEMLQDFAKIIKTLQEKPPVLMVKL